MTEEKYPNTNYNYNDGKEDHGTVIDFKNFDWTKANNEDIIRFGKTLDLPERGIPLGETRILLKALEDIKYPLDREMTILETGIFYGTSTRIFIAFTLKNGGKIYSCESSPKELFKDIMEKADYWQYVNMLLGDSLRCEWNKPIDFLFIDSGHSFKMCYGEYSKFIKYLVKDGIIGFHDTLTFEDNNGVRRTIEKMKEELGDKIVLKYSSEVDNGIEFFQLKE